MQFSANHNKLSQKRLCEGFVLVLVYFGSASVSTGLREMVPIRISRRQSGDICYFESEDTKFETCRFDTYLVDERQCTCISNQELINGIIYS